MNARHDVIVIGSGFGGSACASRLAAAGLDVVLVERGPWRDTVPVRSMGIRERAPLPRGRRALLSLFRSLGANRLPRGRVLLNRRGLFELHLGLGLHVVCAAGVGGGSHVYAGLNERPPDPAYWDGIAAGLTAALEPSYRHVLERLGSRAPLADDRVPHRLAERFADNAALDVRTADHELTMGLRFPATPGQPRLVRTDEGIERWEARPGEDGNLGSEGGGKTSLDFAFLARALEHGLSVLDLHEALDIRAVARGGYEVDLRDHRRKRVVTRHAARVVVAAGTLNTLRLLLGAVAGGGLQPMPRLGLGFGGNGDFFGYWKLDDETRDLSRAHPAHGLLRPRDPAALGAGRPWPMIAEGALPGPHVLPLGRWLGRLQTRGSFVAGMGADAQDGIVTWRRGRLHVAYRAANSDIYERIRDAFRLLGDYSGRPVYHFATPITVHPTGGACIGSDTTRGVVDAQGECLANPGLYVADAAAFTRPVGGPPSLSIAAWGDYVARGIVAAHGAVPFKDR